MLYIWLQHKQRGKGIYLPDERNWTGDITLRQGEAGWPERLLLPVRVLDGNWYMQRPKAYAWKGAPDLEEMELTAASQLTLIGPPGDIHLVIGSCTRENTIMDKYLLPAEQSLQIGRDKGSDICLKEGFASARHGVLRRSGGRVSYQDQSSNGSFVNGELIRGQICNLSPGDRIDIPQGLTIFYLGDVLAINRAPQLEQVSRLQPYEPPVPEVDVAEAVRHSPSVYEAYHRSPRRLQKPNLEPIEIEPPLTKAEESELPILLQVGPSLTMILPMLMATLMMNRAGAGLVMVGTSAALAVVWGFFNRKHRKEQAALKEAQRLATCSSYYAEVEERLRIEKSREEQRLNHNFLSLQQCVEMPRSNAHRLWERLPTHQDFLAARLGLGEVPLPAPIQIPKDKLSLVEDPLRFEPKRLYDSYSILRDVPLTIDTAQHQVIGVLGAERSPWMLQSMLMQLAAYHSYHDVKMAVLYSPEHRAVWEWARWLPHVFSSDDRALRMVVSSRAAIHEVLSYLDNVLSVRVERAGNPVAAAEGAAVRDEPRSQGALPHYVVFVTAPELIENEPILRYASQSGLGFTMLVQAPSMEHLPKECKLIIDARNNLGSVYTSEGDVTGVRYEIPSRQQLSEFSQQLAGIRVHDAVESAAIPSMVTFLDAYAVRRVEELDIWRHWNENHPYEGIKSIIGLRAGSQPFMLDISDKFHGPHGLIGGTTGSGKSVLLESYILSTAVNYHPMDVQFVLIDYKGGGTSEAFRDLPHVVGVIDNLQGERVIFRALASIQGEITRRLALFKEAGVNNIDSYMQSIDRSPDDKPMGHLIVVVDEFAELKDEQPEFMESLVSAARIGRSVGVHLILATQKPAGAVSDSIDANSRFRICLRVASTGDSKEMLKRPDAAYIRGMGRCFVRVGNDELFEQVQTSFSGAAYDPQALSPQEEPRLLNEAGQPIVMKKLRKGAGQKKQTQMQAVLSHIAQTVQQHGLQPLRRLWQDELATTLMLESIAELRGQMYAQGRWPAMPGDELVSFYGLADSIASQEYRLLNMDFLADRSHLIIGLSGTGKTTALQTIAVSLALRYTPAQVNIYAFSLTSKQLGCLSALPHTGDVVFEESPDEQSRLLHLLLDESARRKELFSELSTDNIVSYNKAVHLRPNLAAVPYIVVLVDRMQQLRDWEKDREQDLNRFYDLLKEGAARGIYFVLTALAKNELMLRHQAFVSTVALQLEDRASFAEVLGIRVPSDWNGIMACEGRGAIASEQGPLEMQVALYGSSESDAARADAIVSLGQEMSAAWQGPRPASIPRIPRDVRLSQFLAGLTPAESWKQAAWLPLGYHKQTAQPLYAKLQDYHSFLITGPAKSGKSSLIMQLALLLRAMGGEVQLIGGMELQRWGSAQGFDVMQPGEPRCQAYLAGLPAALVKPRSDALKLAREQGIEAYAAQTAGFKPYALLIDDLDALIEQCEDNEAGREAVNSLRHYPVDRTRPYRIHLIASVSHKAAEKHRLKEPLSTLINQARFLLLQGRIDKLSFVQAAMSAAQRRLQMPLGEAWMMEGGEGQPLLIPAPDED